MLLSQYEFLYSSLVIKLVTQVSLVFMQLSVTGAAFIKWKCKIYPTFYMLEILQLAENALNHRECSADFHCTY